ncbi:MAG: hypothetical protein KUG62_04320, partial [Rhodobacteraceae bacterium]|nr:hypothetical protein [Paracoccaceae bacterium]
MAVRKLGRQIGPDHVTTGMIAARLNLLTKKAPEKGPFAVVWTNGSVRPAYAGQIVGLRWCVGPQSLKACF